MVLKIPVAQLSQRLVWSSVCVCPGTRVFLSFLLEFPGHLCVEQTLLVPWLYTLRGSARQHWGCFLLNVWDSVSEVFFWLGSVLSLLAQSKLLPNAAVNHRSCWRTFSVSLSTGWMDSGACSSAVGWLPEFPEGCVLNGFLLPCTTSFTSLLVCIGAREL